MKLFQYKNSSFFFVMILWLILTGININKAFHIDDTFHLEAAQCISKEPTKPMLGKINWGESPTPMYKHNQPPLFFYLISAHQFFFGNSEVSLHLLLSIFTFFSLFFFWKLTQFLNIKSPITLLIICAFCPAFIVNQNVMTDVPILSLSLGVIYFLLKGQRDDSFKYYLISSILLTAGLLIKYSLLPILFVILICIFTSKSPKKSIVLLIPITALFLWSIWNYIEFGEIHILSRPKSNYSFIKIISFFSTLGSVAIFTPVFVYHFLKYKITSLIIVTITIVFLLSIPLVYLEIIDEFRFNLILNYFFLINGIVLIFFVVYQTFLSFKKEQKKYFKSPYFVLIIYILGVSMFIAFFAPFNATRHILLIIPFILLFGHKKFENTTYFINKLVIALSIILGIVLGISDWIYADFYRKSVEKISFPDKKIWTLGHWGWQWYSKKSGMLFYSKENEINIRNGHILIIPKDISKQKINNNIKIDTIDYITEPSNFFTFFSGKNFASMYNSSFEKSAWCLSKKTIDTIFICLVKKEVELKHLINPKKGIKHKLPLDSIIAIEPKWLIEQKKKIN